MHFNMHCVGAVIPLTGIVLFCMICSLEPADLKRLVLVKFGFNLIQLTVQRLFTDIISYQRKKLKNLN